ncbi:hypothetical protein Ahy_A06g029550 [Arachis hypogaea]|uniref:RNase H type-1 domain-containing protein n=1 Tax=Arachis hypogaea TaxID=3818 RepID=A0A445CTT1_ARAHY|nr:hypothetical protein Ahy_A06g029550 [Arachis hypogaea]
MAATATVSELKNMCKKHKPAIVYLMETRCKEKNVKKFARKLQFKNSFCVEPWGLSGVYSWCQNYIIADIKSNNNPNWKCCFTYGNPIFKQRRRTWQAISESKDLMDEPSCFIGDFNDILHQEEKIGKHPKPRIQIEEFRNLVHKKNLMDLELKGSKFTWFSNPREGFIFNHAKLIALPAISSDHCPLLLNIEPNQRVPRQFRYEAYWDDKEECKEVIRKGWTSKAQGGDWNNFMEKTSNCIKNLQEWNRKSFKRADEEITRLQRSLRRTDYCGPSGRMENSQPKQVWFGSQSQCTPTNQNVRSVGQWLQQMYIKCKEANRTEVDQNWSRIGITMWTIWKARNNYEYNNIEPNPESTINHARIIEKEYNSLIKENISKVREDNKGRSLPVIWRPPPQSWLKVNSDAAFSIGTKTGATASVIRDHTGKILGGSATVIQANSSLSAEAQALREAEWLIGRLRGSRIGAIGKGRHLYRIEHQTNQACRDPIRLLLCQSAAYLGIISIGACFVASGFQQPSFCESE